MESNCSSFWLDKVKSLPFFELSVPLSVDHLLWQISHISQSYRHLLIFEVLPAQLSLHVVREHDALERLYKLILSALRAVHSTHVGSSFSAKVPRSSAEVRRVFIHDIMEVEGVGQ